MERQHFVTISRTAAFSRQMSLLFKLYLNAILSGAYGGREALAVAVVYSGGDDVFLVGAWNDALEAARRVRAALREFACGSLSISGGVGLYDDKYPIRLAAEETAALEDEAKSRPGKDAIALFAPDSGNVYSWDAFEKQVLDSKLRELDRFFSGKDQNRGTAFLYRILELLRTVQEDPQQKMPLARLAYLLSRLAPAGNGPAREHYRTFSNRVMDWALHREDRAALITAIYLYVYRNRKEEKR